MAPPFKNANFDIIFGKGIFKEGSILEAALEYDIVKKSGSWYSYGDVRLGQGADNSAQYLLANPELKEKLVREILSTTKIPALQRRLEEMERKNPSPKPGDDGKKDTTKKETVKAGE